MKKLLSGVLLTAALLMTGCGSDAGGCYRSVVDAYPDSEIRISPRSSYEFFIRTPDGDIRYVRTWNKTDVDISYDVLLFAGSK